LFVLTEGQTFYRCASALIHKPETVAYTLLRIFDLHLPISSLQSS